MSEPPKRGSEHVFIGEWRAEGTNYDADGKTSSWVSSHTGRWHTGQFSLVQDEKANPGPQPFDTRVWTFTGEQLGEDGRRQTIAWEWKPKDRWQPLCDRVAVRTD